MASDGSRRAWPSPVEGSKLLAKVGDIGSGPKKKKKERASEIEGQSDGGRDRKTVVGEERGFPGRRIGDESGKPAVVVIGDVQYLTIEAQLPFWKQPGLVGAQIEAFVGADSQDRWQECGYRESGAVQCFCTETHARPEAIAGEEIDGVALVGQRGGIGRI